MSQTVRLLSYPVHLVSHDEALQRITQSLAAKTNLHIVTLNPEMLMQGDADPELGAILRSAGLVIPDGAGVVWALRRQGYPDVKRLPGIELSEAVLLHADSCQLRVAIVGAAPEVLEQACLNLKARYPRLQIVFQHHGFMTSSRDEQAVAKECADHRPDVLLVALGVPKQEKWIHQYEHLFQGTVFIGVGGSLDIWSGLKQRAPAFFLKTNLEWLYRITSEPWRIKRTYRTLPLFVVKVCLSKPDQP